MKAIRSRVETLEVVSGAPSLVVHIRTLGTGDPDSPVEITQHSTCLKWVRADGESVPDFRARAAREAVGQPGAGTIALTEINFTTKELA